MEDKWECGCSKKSVMEELTKCEDWEIKRKKKWEEILVNDKAPNCPGHEISQEPLAQQKSDWVYSSGSFGTTHILCPNNCGAEIKIINEYGDEKELEHTCPQQSQPTTSELSSLKSYFQTNKIKQISLTNEGKLLIEYQNSQAKKTEANNQQLQQIKSYLQTSSSKVLSMNTIEREREREREQNQPKSNTILYVSLGLGGLVLIGGLVYWFTRKKKDKVLSER